MKQIFLLCVMVYAIFKIHAQNGSLDQGFNSVGKIDQTYETANSICTDKDKKVLVLGHDNTTGNYNIYVSRYNSNGSVDNSFAGNGRFLNDINNDRDYGRCIKSLPNGKYLVSGQNSVGPYFRAFILRLKNNGTIDSSFGSNGILLIDRNQLNCDLWAFEVASSGSIYAAGYRTVGSNLKSVLWKIKPNGVIDSSFGSNGEKLISTNSYMERLYGIDLNEGMASLAVAGVSNNGSNNEGIVALLDTNGNLKTSFNSTGTKKVVFGGNTTNLSDVCLKSNQVIVCGNNAVSGNLKALMVSYTLSGSLNSSFGNNGTYDENSLSNSHFSQMVQDCLGNIFASGNVLINATTNFRITKLNANGFLDSTFANGGQFTSRIKTSNNEFAEAISLYGDSGVMVCGRTNSGSGITNSGIIRLSITACSNTSSIAEFKINSSFYVYPNPLQRGQDLKLKSSNGNTDKVSYSIIAMDGKTVYSGEADSDQELLPKGSNLSPGVYRLLITVAEKLYSLSFQTE